MMIAIFSALLLGAVAWHAWSGPDAWLKKLSAKSRFSVTLAGAGIMAALLLLGNPQNLGVTAPLMGLVFALALLFGYLDVRREASRSA